jgi:hypothetical protein
MGMGLLWRGVLDKVNALLNVGFQAFDSNVKQFLLLLGDTPEDVDSALGATGLYPKVSPASSRMKECCDKLPRVRLARRRSQPR